MPRSLEPVSGDVAQLRRVFGCFPSGVAALCVLNSTAWLDCSPYAEVPAGDHTIALLEIHRMTADPATAPLVFHASTFRRLHVAP
jgi:flavin reductase (DIM6/NTAB) family NADH-FMN oxidoreductase RutF